MKSIKYKYMMQVTGLHNNSTVWNKLLFDNEDKLVDTDDFAYAEHLALIAVNKTGMKLLKLSRIKITTETIYSKDY